MKKWLVTFTTSTSSLSLRETVEESSWQYAEQKLRSRYSGVRVLQYTPVN
jgi:hypothetical protein